MKELEYFRQHRLAADKRLRYASPKLPSATSFIRKTLYEIGLLKYGGEKYELLASCCWRWWKGLL